MWNQGQKVPEYTDPYLLALWAGAGSRSQCGTQYPESSPGILQGCTVGHTETGGPRPAQSLWTEGHYRLSAMRERQAHWMKEEPPAHLCRGASGPFISYCIERQAPRPSMPGLMKGSDLPAERQRGQLRD